MGRLGAVAARLTDTFLETGCRLPLLALARNAYPHEIPVMTLCPHCRANDQRLRCAYAVSDNCSQENGRQLAGRGRDPLARNLGRIKEVEQRRDVRW